MRKGVPVQKIIWNWIEPKINDNLFNTTDVAVVITITITMFLNILFLMSVFCWRESIILVLVVINIDIQGWIRFGNNIIICCCGVVVVVVVGSIKCSISISISISEQPISNLVFCRNLQLLLWQQEF